jgi:hypothetical protein
MLFSITLNFIDTIIHIEYKKRYFIYRLRYSYLLLP